MGLLARKRKTRSIPAPTMSGFSIRSTARRISRLVCRPLPSRWGCAFGVCRARCHRCPLGGTHRDDLSGASGRGAILNDVDDAGGAEIPAGTRLTSMPFWALWQYRVQRRARILQTNGRAAGSIAYELAYAARVPFSGRSSAAHGCGIWWRGRCWCRKPEGRSSLATARHVAGVIGRRSSSALKVPFGQDPAALRKLFIYMLAGNTQVVQQRAARSPCAAPASGGKHGGIYAKRGVPSQAKCSKGKIMSDQETVANMERVWRPL